MSTPLSLLVSVILRRYFRSISARKATLTKHETSTCGTKLVAIIILREASVCLGSNSDQFTGGKTEW